MRTTIFANDEYHHIYNRGVDNREVFLNEKDYLRFLVGMKEFNSNSDREERLREIEKKKAGKSEGKSESDSESESDSDLPSYKEQKLVSIIAYCLNSNHYHFILKQLQENGISKFMQKVGTGYTNYFNKKNDRSGALFQGKFKSIHIDSNEYLLYLSAYVNANHFIHGYNQKQNRPLGPAGDWPYSSLLDYLGKRNGTLSVRDSILEQFNDTQEYAKFVQDNALYLKEKKEMEKYILE